MDEAYTDCLKFLELATPIKLAPLFSFLKRLGCNVKKNISENSNRVSQFYVVYILSAGLIDDL